MTDVTEYRDQGGGAGIRRAQGLGPGGTIQEVLLSGLRGRGGGGFPTGRKWQSVRDAASATGEEGNQPFVVCNAAEGEPARSRTGPSSAPTPTRSSRGSPIAAFAVGAARAFIGIKERFGSEVERLATRGRRDDRGGPGRATCTIQVVLGPDAYLFGEETALLEVIEGEAPLPRTVPPYIYGLFATVPGSGLERGAGRPVGAGADVEPHGRQQRRDARHRDPGAGPGPGVAPLAGHRASRRA